MSKNQHTNNESLKTFYTQALLGTFIGWLASLYASYHLATVLTGQISPSSFCNINSTVNCTTIALSKWGSFLSIPVANWGLLYFGTMLLLTLWGRLELSNPEAKDNLSLLSLIKTGSFIGVGVSLILFLISALIVRTICPACVVVYAATIILTYASLRAPSTKGLGLVENLKKVPQALWVLMIVVGCLGLFADKVFVQAIKNEPGLDSETSKLILNEIKSAPEHRFDVSDNPTNGPSDAPVTIVEFSDFQCPFCARAAKILPQLRIIFPTQLKIVSKNYPLDASCNPDMKGGGHALACLAAKLGRCVFKLSGNEPFKHYKSMAFEKQEDLNKELLLEIARNSSQKSTAELEQCVDSSDTQEAILRDIREAKSAGVDATPSIYINGRKFRGGFDLELLRQAVESFAK